MPSDPQAKKKNTFHVFLALQQQTRSPSYHDSQKTERDVSSLAASLGRDLDMVLSPKPQAKPSGHSSVSLACISVTSNSPRNQTHKLLNLCCGSFMRY